MGARNGSLIYLIYVIQLATIAVIFNSCISKGSVYNWHNNKKASAQRREQLVQLIIRGGGRTAFDMFTRTMAALGFPSVVLSWFELFGQKCLILPGPLQISRAFFFPCFRTKCGPSFYSFLNIVHFCQTIVFHLYPSVSLNEFCMWKAMLNTQSHRAYRKLCIGHMPWC